MKATGIVRKIDELGRLVIPMELRKTMKIGEKDPMEIFVSGDVIMLKKYAPGCTFCGCSSTERRIESLFDKPVCAGCIEKIKDWI